MVGARGRSNDPDRMSHRRGQQASTVPMARMHPFQAVAQRGPRDDQPGRKEFRHLGSLSPAIAVHAQRERSRAGEADRIRRATRWSRPIPVTWPDGPDACRQAASNRPIAVESGPAGVAPTSLDCQERICIVGVGIEPEARAEAVDHFGQAVAALAAALPFLAPPRLRIQPATPHHAERAQVGRGSCAAVDRGASASTGIRYAASTLSGRHHRKARAVERSRRIARRRRAAVHRDARAGVRQR